MSKNTFAKEEKNPTPSTVSCIFFLVPLILLHPLPPDRVIFLLGACTGFNKAFVSLQGCSFRFSFIPHCQDGVGRQLKSQADNIVWG